MLTTAYNHLINRLKSLLEQAFVGSKVQLLHETEGPYIPGRSDPSYTALCLDVSTHPPLSLDVLPRQNCELLPSQLHLPPKTLKDLDLVLLDYGSQVVWKCGNTELRWLGSFSIRFAFPNLG